MLEPSVVAPGDRVLVIGPGPIGLLAAQVAALTAAEVVVLGLPNDASRLAIAKRLGLTVATDPMGLGTYDAVVECSGSADGAATALAAVRSGGRFVQLGIFGRDVSVPLDHVILKELTLRTGFATTPPSWSHALGLIARGDINLSEVVSEVVGLREFARAFDDLRRGVAAKIVFDPRLDETVPVAGTAIVPISDERGVASRSS
jgi:L-iditol 2-dehydrogenase